MGFSSCLPVFLFKSGHYLNAGLPPVRLRATDVAAGTTLFHDLVEVGREASVAAEKPHRARDTLEPDRPGSPRIRLTEQPSSMSPGRAARGGPKLCAVASGSLDRERGPRARTAPIQHAHAGLTRRNIPDFLCSEEVAHAKWFVRAYQRILGTLVGF